MKKHEISELEKHWDYITKYISYPKNDKQVEKLINTLDELLEIIGDNEKHRLIGLVDLASYLIEEYESNRYQSAQEEPTGIDALKFLMEAHGFHQNDLPEIGSQGVVSEILSGKRDLNVKQIMKLSKKFGVSPSTFLPNEAIQERETAFRSTKFNHCLSHRNPHLPKDSPQNSTHF